MMVDTLSGNQSYFVIMHRIIAGEELSLENERDASCFDIVAPRRRMGCTMYPSCPFGQEDVRLVGYAAAESSAMHINIIISWFVNMDR